MDGTLDSEFRAASQAVKSVRRRPSNEDLLTLYGLYKQAEQGNNTTAKPGFLQLEAKAKWDAWTARRGLSQEDAQREYIRFTKTVIEKYS